MNNNKLTERQKAEAELYNLIEQCKAGKIYISVLTDYLMDNLSEKGFRTLSDAYDASQEGQPLN
jgi:hypothetical protein